jgi:ribonuclease VapC
MIVDASALVAILLEEPGYQEFRDAILRAPKPRMSAAGYIESSIVVDRVGDPVKSRRLDEIIDAFGIGVVPVTASHARRARYAHRDFGRGSGHRAGLNFGDVFAYALAAETGEPLLYKGNDFGQTDVRSAV